MEVCDFLGSDNVYFKLRFHIFNVTRQYNTEIISKTCGGDY